MRFPKGPTCYQLQHNLAKVKCNHQIHKHLIDVIRLLAIDAQAAAIGALVNLQSILLKVIKTPHPVPEVCRKAAMILESFVSEPQNRILLLAYENAFSEILFTDSKHSHTFARILYELTTRPSNKVATTHGIAYRVS